MTENYTTTANTGAFLSAFDEALAAAKVAKEAKKRAAAASRNDDLRDALRDYARFYNDTPGLNDDACGDQFHPLFQDSEWFFPEIKASTSDKIMFTNYRDDGQWHVGYFSVPRLWFTNQPKAKIALQAEAQATLDAAHAEALAEAEAHTAEARAQYLALHAKFADSDSQAGEKS